MTEYMHRLGDRCKSDWEWEAIEVIDPRPSYELRRERQMSLTQHHEANPPEKNLTESETDEPDKLLDWSANDEPV